MKSFLTVFSLGIALAIAGNAYAADKEWRGDCDNVWSSVNNWANACALGSLPGDNDDVDIDAAIDDSTRCVYDFVLGTDDGPALTSLEIFADGTSGMELEISSSATEPFSTATLKFTGYSSSNPAVLDYDEDQLTVDTSTTVLKEVVFEIADCVLFQPNDLIVGVSDNSNYGDLTLNGTGDLRPNEVEIHAKSTGNPSYIRGAGTILVTDG